MVQFNRLQNLRRGPKPFDKQLFPSTVLISKRGSPSFGRDVRKIE